MRGLDPRIHLFKRMDCRVKPGNDEHKHLQQQRADRATPNGYINLARHVRAFCV